jgi:hypothetical protein
MLDKSFYCNVISLQGSENWPHWTAIKPQEASTKWKNFSLSGEKLENKGHLGRRLNAEHEGAEMLVWGTWFRAPSRSTLRPFTSVDPSTDGKS